VLRRVIRRAVRHAYSRFDVERALLPAVVDAVVEVMGPAYPDLVRNADHIKEVIAREEHNFQATIRTGLRQLEQELSGGRVTGDAAFKLHDTYGFPIDLTRELAAERGVDIDMAGFEAAMAEQRQRARSASVKVPAGGDVDYRGLLDEFGPTEFTGYTELESKANVVAVIERDDGTLEVFLDRSPFYAEGGGQIGDTGTIATDAGRVEVIDTTYALPALHRHLARPIDGRVEPGQEATAVVDAERRDAIRRNHTGTHILHWALREVLGSHVKQAGSYVGPDRLRFDFSHHAAVSPEELARVEAIANERVIANEPVRAYETSMDEAQRLGAIMFFGDKYGDFVRVVEAGTRSMELCGGTHVNALGMIGPIKIVSEGSIGSNLRRIEALTGAASLERVREEEETLTRAATLLRVKPDELVDRVEREIESRKALEDELKTLRRKLAGGESSELAAGAVDGVVVARRDGTTRDELRDLAVAVRDQPGVRAVVLGGEPEGGGVALVAAVAKESGLLASDLIADAAKLVGGGGVKNPDLAMAGGRDPAQLDAALDAARRAAGI
jgi:alanyl-tRNA synthetase